MKTILLIEDNPVDVFLVEEALRAASVDYRLYVIEDGRVAVDQVREGLPATPRPDLVLLDLNLPTTSGADVLRAIRNSETLRETPVAILTSSGTPEDRSKVARFGVVDYLVKPMDLDEFLKLGLIVREILASNGSSKQLRGIAV